jgi:superfamily II DNA or RNA helicase
MILRDYQQETVAAVLKEWETVGSTLVSMPTGGGKTVTFAEIIRRSQPSRAMVLTHREEICFQNRETIERLTGLGVEIEMSILRSSVNLFNRAPVVVATVQTLISGGAKKRMEIFNPDDFGVLVVDECHHGVAKSWKRVIDYFAQNKKLRIAGFTATPDRADEAALGRVFETVAIDLEILDLIERGWLVPVDQQLVEIEGLDFSAIRTTAGDLNGADLSAVMEAEKNLQGIASATLDIIGVRKTLVFTASIKQSEMLSDIFNRHRPDMSAWLCGKTPKEDRRKILRNFAEGQTQVLVNCMVLGEGWDGPTVQVIVQARPTKSRSLYAQQIGRGLRPLAGTVDGLEDAHSRREAIAHSFKPSALVVDFVGNSGKHKLMTTADILGGKVSDEAIDRATKHARENGGAVRMDQLLEEEENKLLEEAEERKRKEIARKARLVGKATYSKYSINPFDVFHLTPTKARGWDQGKQISEKMRLLLVRQGIDPGELTYAQARQVIGEFFRRWDNKLCTIKQAKFLNNKGYDTKEMTMEHASKIMNAWSANGWRRPEVEP